LRITCGALANEEIMSVIKHDFGKKNRLIA
jgi:hypothetical protein